MALTVPQPKHHLWIDLKNLSELEALCKEEWVAFPQTRQYVVRLFVPSNLLLGRTMRNTSGVVCGKSLLYYNAPLVF